VLFWIVAATGGRHVFVKQVLGKAYDLPAEHLLRGDPGVDVEAIHHEAIIVDGKVRMYFGPFPRSLAYSFELHLSGWTRNLVAYFRILCGRYRSFGFCRADFAKSVLFCAFIVLAQMVGERVRGWIRIGLAAVIPTRKSLHL
jgi:hypothetical protein